ncbi:hypothetical protein RirG_239240 [Rhizophagus irregularis DAOM 197198w]|uniref:Uncharacterized protein n=1 Tax=Rhizophagus irregularis (strain DAOM 197198w) TaxID=1432141 RepID=A0A015JG65_RHIIW|nr:hypothetical protein RirG_239240 [Rhizophagus irregularis DAOM 197198w]
MKESLQLKMQDELIGDSRKCGYRMTQVAGQTPNHNNELSKDEEQIEESSPSLLGMKVPSKKQSGNSRQNGRVTRQTKTKNELETTAIKNSQKRVALVQGERKITERMSQVAT